jgi:hypothetical protein
MALRALSRAVASGKDQERTTGQEGKLMKKLILALVIAAAAGYGVLSYHFVLFDGNLKILKKTGLRYENTFVDARGAKKLQLALKPDLLAAGINDVVKEVDQSVKTAK